MAEKKQESRTSDGAVKITRKKRYQLGIENVSLKGLKLQQRFKSDHHNVYTEQIMKNELNSNDDKRLQTFDKIATYSYGTNIFKVCES